MQYPLKLDWRLNVIIHADLKAGKLVPCMRDVRFGLGWPHQSQCLLVQTFRLLFG